MNESASGEEQASMFETALLLGFCLLAALVSALIVVWLAVAGRLFSLDGLTLSLICLTLGGFFSFPVFLSFRKGELQALVNHYLKRSSAAPSAGTAEAKKEEASEPSEK
jgi:hypothetical protein